MKKYNAIRFWILSIVGALTVIELVQKLITCAACPKSYLGYEMAGYTYVALQTIIAGLLLYGAYKIKSPTHSSKSAQD